MASDGESERWKRRQHRGVLLPFGTAVMFRDAGKVPGGVMTERWHLGTCLGERFHTEEHVEARKGDGLVIRSNGRFGRDQGLSLSPQFFLKCTAVPRPTLSRDEPPFLPIEERPVPRKRKNHTRQVVQNAGNCRATNTPIQVWHILRIVGSGLRQQAGLTLCIVIVLNVQNNET